MKYSKEEVIQFIQEEDVKFIRLAFCDVFGKQKNISIMSSEIERAFKYGIAIDAWAIDGFNHEVRSDLFLHPDPSTLVILPWRPENGRVVRMFCDITYPDGTIFESDSRHLLIQAMEEAKKEGYCFQFGAEMEFYLFEKDEMNQPTKQPFDTAGYMDIAPEDRGENVRREICLTLEQMDIYPESSHHEEGPGQNEIDFRYADALTSADQAVTFMSVVKTIANQHGLYASFSPKPLKKCPGNGMHINFSIQNQEEMLSYAIAGILKYIPDMTFFLNPMKESYERLGKNKAPKYISWSHENRSQLIRIPAALGEYKRAELRSPDPTANPYIAYTLIIYAALYGIKHQLELPKAADINLYAIHEQKYPLLPATFEEAKEKATNSSFIKEHLPATLIQTYINR